MSARSLNIPEDSKIQRQTKLTQTDIDKLAENPSNLVYKFTTDSDAASIPRLTAEKARDCAKMLIEKYNQLKDEHPTWTDINIRNSLICTDVFRMFKKAYPKFFDKCTDRNTTTEQISYVFYMFYMQSQIERGTISKQQANEMVQKYFLEKYARPKTQDDK